MKETMKRPKSQMKKGNGIYDLMSQMASQETPTSLFAISSICADVNQPRKKFDKDEINNLAESIKEVGVLQPLLLKSREGNSPYVIIDGERRWRAAKIAGLIEVPGYVRSDISENNTSLAQVIANSNRTDLTDFELAQSIRKALSENPKLKKKEIASLFNKKPSFVSRLLSMLDEQWIPLVEDGIIETASDLEYLRGAPEEIQKELIDNARKNGGVIKESDVREARRNHFFAINEDEIEKASVLRTAEEYPESEGLQRYDEQSNPGKKNQDNGVMGNAVLEEARIITKNKGVEKKDGGVDESDFLNSESVILMLTVENIKKLAAKLLDKTKTKIELHLPHHLAIDLVEKFGIPHPKKVSDFSEIIEKYLNKI